MAKEESHPRVVLEGVPRATREENQVKEGQERAAQGVARATVVGEAIHQDGAALVTLNVRGTSAAQLHASGAKLKPWQLVY